MPMTTKTARLFKSQQIHYLRKSITFADHGKTVEVGVIPAGSQLVKPISGVAVNVAFNGSTTNTLDIGPSDDPGTNLWATTLALGTIGFVPLDEVVSNLVTNDTIVSAGVVSTASASSGQGEIIIAYIPDNDL